MCDAVLHVHSSGAALEHLAAHGVIQPVDRGGERYRCHPLLHDLLRAELHRKEPSLVPELHRRAARWYGDARLPDQAIDHAHLAGDLDHLGRLVLEWAQPTWTAGRIDTVQRWMSWLEEAHDIETFPAVAAHAALIFALVGESAHAQRWSDMARTVPGSGTLADGSTVEGTVAYLRAIEAQGRHGADAGRRADRARGSLAGQPVPRGDAAHRGPRRAARRALSTARTTCSSRPSSPPSSPAPSRSSRWTCASAQRSRRSVATGRPPWTRCVAPRRSSTDGGFGAYWTSAIVHAWAARVAVHLGLRADAVDHTRRALALRPLLTYALPVVSTQALLATAHACLGLGDLHAASQTVRQAQEILRRRPGLGDLSERAEALAARVHEASTEGRPGALTPAEVRLMPLLATHLTFPLIAERLGVSRNTVKTQAISTYRKLGVSSRSEAVARWELLDGTGRA